MLFLFADIPSAGRFDTSMLSDTDRMALLFTPDDEEDARKQLEGDASDPCSWTGVFCHDPGQVEIIDWHKYELDISGSFDFRMLPSTLLDLNLYRLDLYGEVDLRQLPASLDSLKVRKCRFTGTLDLKDLPRGLKTLIFYCNAITAIEKIENLPGDLIACDICEPTVRQPVLEVGELPEGPLRIDMRGTPIEKICCDRPDDAQRVLTGTKEDKKKSFWFNIA